MTKRNFCRLKFLLSVLLLISFGACDNSVDPVDKDLGIFSIYGAIDIDAQVNYIRVRDLNAPFTLEATEELDAEVVLENINSGFSETLTSIRKEADGVYVHNFEVTQSIVPDNDYRIYVTRSDGRQVVLDMTSPNKAVFEVTPEVNSCFTPVTITLSNVQTGTVTVSIGVPFRGRYWMEPDVFRVTNEGANNEYEITYNPGGLLGGIPANFEDEVTCEDINGEEYLVSISHYGPGFYEKLFVESFDILETSKRFGSYYQDTLATKLSFPE
ncbi:hypothetical protein [Gracilimonas sp.]|uniref:hypothetical protein n=1 Tax=Gracilimonas sp. TaxID=1974203 RepID=UPI0032EF4A80